MERGDVTARTAGSKSSQNSDVVWYNVKASIRQIETWSDVKQVWASVHFSFRTVLCTDDSLLPHD